MFLVVCLLVALAVPVTAIASVAAGHCGADVDWKLDVNGTLHITGTGAMTEYTSSSKVPWASYRDQIKVAVVADGVTSVTPYAFYQCKTLTDVYIGDDVTEIGEKAFYQCTGLLTASVGEAAEKLDGEIFSGCSALQAVYLGSMVKEIGSKTFYLCNALTHVFYNGTKSQWRNNVTVEAGNANIKEDAEDLLNYLDAPYTGDCGEVTWTFDPKTFCLEITGNGKMEDYDIDADRPWDEFSAIIRSAEIGEGVTYIGTRSFRYVKNLYEITIGTTVTEIGNKAFNRTNGLKNVYYYGTEAGWKAVTVGSDNEMLAAATINYVTDCPHNSVEETWVTNGDKTHTIKAFCGLCGEILRGPFVIDCSDSNGDNRCDVCYGDMAPEACTHANATYEYVQNTEGVNHTKWLNCTDCLAHEDLGVAPCVDSNADTKCDLCKATITAACTHTETTTSYTAVDGLYHTVKVTCKCGEVISETTASHSDADLNYVCDDCSGAIEGGTGDGGETCTHTNTTTAYTAVDGKTHTVTVTCQCGEVVSETSAACADNDKDFVCDVCEADMEYITWSFNATTGVLTIKGRGPMEDYASGSKIPWYNARSNVKSVVIEEGVTHIGAYSFYYCISMADAVIPASVKSIGNYAFRGCSALARVTYGGTESGWAAIEIGDYNTPLTEAAVSTNCGHSDVTETVTANADKTHTITAVCNSCGEVLEPVTDSCTEGEAVCTAGEGVHTTTVKCTVCEQTLEEETAPCTDTTETVTCNEDRTHTVTVKCNTCGGTVSSETAPCTDGEDEDKKCDVCDFDLTCSHPSFVFGYNANGDHKTHTYAYNCQICGEECNAIEEQDCFGTDGETCDKCGQDYSCQHNEEDLRTETEYHPTDKTEVYTHNKMTVVYCDGEDCDLPGCIFSSTFVEEQNCADADGDDKCDLCLRDMVCGHEDTTTTNTHNGHDTHQLVVTCNICGDEVQNVEVDCIYRELGGTCMICKAACKHEYTYTYNKKNDAQQHFTEAKCGYCGYELAPVAESCVDAEPHDNVCDRCEADVVCDHEVKTVYVSNNNGTHKVINRCNSCTDQEAPCEKCEAFWGLEEAVACADGEDEDYTCDKCKYAYGEAAVNTVAYATFAEAMDAAENGDTIILLKDVELDAQLIVEKNLTFDFGENTLTTYAVDSAYDIIVRGELTIKSGIFDVTGLYGIGTTATGVLTIDGGEFYAVNDCDYLVANYGTLTISGGEFDAYYCAVNNFDGTTTITGGSFASADLQYEEWDDSADLMANDGMAVSGGVFSKPVDEAYCADGYEPCDNGDGTYGVKEIEPIVKFNIVGANMTLGNDLKINFMIRKSDMQDGFVAKVSQAGGEPTELQLWSYNALYYAASYSVAAKEMTDVLSVEIYNADGRVVSNPFTRTIKQYAMTLLNNASQKDSLKSVIVDMLNYGAEAQKYFGHNTDALANAEVTAEQQTAYATATVECTNNQQAGANFVGANLSLEDSILLNVFFKNATGMRAVVEYTDYTGVKQSYETTVEAYGTMGKVVIDKIVLADSRCPISVKVYDTDGVLHGEGVESVESYIARNLTNADTGDLNMAIMKFATSAYNHLGGTN